MDIDTKRAIAKIVLNIAAALIIKKLVDRIE